MKKARTSRRTTEPDAERIPHWRLFAAVPVSDEVRALMRTLRAAIEPTGWEVRWVDPALAHLTVKFFGDTNPAHVGTLESKLAFAAERCVPFALEPGDFQLLGPRQRPNVLSLAIDGASDEPDAMQRFEELVAQVERQTTGVGAGGNQRGFKAHLTLGRFREQAPDDALATLATIDVPATRFEIDRLELVRSVLSQAGPSYTTVASWPLVAPAAAPDTTDHG